MSSFETQEWHVLTGLCILGFGVIKPELMSAITSYFIAAEQKQKVGKKILIKSEFGDWQRVTVDKVEWAIPFFCDGGVFVLHEGENTVQTHEKFAFSVWSTLRIRQSK